MSSTQLFYPLDIEQLGMNVRFSTPSGMKLMKALLIDSFLIKANYNQV
ncbi:MAG: hypothetical protein ACTSUE_14580 [Promethearchaeota archaeon]